MPPLLGLQITVARPVDEIRSHRQQRDGTMSSNEPASLYHLVLQGFADLGFAANASIKRRILLKDGFFVGEVFHGGGLVATYLPERSAIEFYGADGYLLSTVVLPGDGMRRAA